MTGAMVLHQKASHQVALNKGDWNGNGDFAREAAPDGLYDVELVEIKEKMLPSFNDPTVEEAKWMWQFVATRAIGQDDDGHMDTNGKPYEFGKWTGRKYGNDKAGLTILLDGILGRRMTAIEWAEFDPEELVGGAYRANISTKQKEDGSIKNEIVKVFPIPRRTPPGADKTLSTPAKPTPKTVVNSRQPAYAGSAAASMASAARPNIGSVEGESLLDPQGRAPGDEGYDPYEEA